MPTTMTTINTEPDMTSEEEGENMTSCDKCAKRCEFSTLAGPNSKHEWLCEKCDMKFDEEEKEEYDDMGVLCRYRKGEGWYAIEDHCVTCGYRCDECECDDGEEKWVYPCEECGDCDEKCDCGSSKMDLVLAKE